MQHSPSTDVVTDEPDGAAAPAAPLAFVRPRLRHDVVFADTGRDGAFLRHSDGGFVLSGRTAYAWLSALSSHLDGTHTVAELCEGLTDERQKIVRDVIGTLLDRGFVRDAVTHPRTLPARTAETFARQLEFIAHYADDEHRRFARFRDARILLAGDDEIVTVAAANLLRNGAARVAVAGANAGAAAALVAARTADARTSATDTSATDTADTDTGSTTGAVTVHTGGLSADELSGYDVVVVLLGRGMRAETLLGRRSVDHPVVLPVTLFPDHVVIGPMTFPGSAPCWNCAMLRLEPSLGPGALAGLWRSVASGTAPATVAPLDAGTAGMVGSEVAFELFRHLTHCLVAETEGSVLVQDRLTLEAVRERLSPHPACPACAGLPVRTAGDRAPERAEIVRPPKQSGAQPYERQFELVARHVGVIMEFPDDRLEQAPVKVARARFAGAAGRPGEAVEVTDFDLHSQLDARTRVLHRGLIGYVDAVAAPPAEQVAGLPVVSGGGLLTRTGLPARPDEPLVRATSMLTGEAVAVPAAAVYPFHEVNTGRLVERSRAGAGSGHSGEDARTAALLSAVSHRSMRAALEGTKPVRLDLDRLATAEDIGFLARAAGRLGAAPEVLLLNPGEPAPTVLVDEPSTPGMWAVVSGLSLHDAVLEALTEVVGRSQLAAAGEPAIWPDAPLVPEFDPRAMAAPTTSDAASDVASDVVVTPREVLDALAEAGCDVFAADLTTPDLALSGYYAVARVLIVERDTSRSTR
ncbi:bacteriocin biosynthesis cyclodehydratase domain-containing protein [Nonomuraea muscovyensis]|uniref:Bacteriocin biosynthesis cyclodehydratase domain-containing protein n=1 Tax=Nonomuraea muscovyensis TaxID=1124761 RepID=A0A7X0C7T6_9ACTN|nr:TOMM precursor leader peptide-binding protein [Nonomuraea muscovyensis]MBB6350127.1 bacteriocin biosynthesis cyclodehydratase domain-containing protein [Nonomuraea muscovyensis]